MEREQRTQDQNENLLIRDGIPVWVINGRFSFGMAEDFAILACVSQLGQLSDGVVDIDITDLALRCGIDTIPAAVRAVHLIEEGALLNHGRGDTGFKLSVPIVPPYNWGSDPPG